MLIGLIAAALLVTAWAPTARALADGEFGAPITDTGWDPDSDGTFEYLTLWTPIEVTSPGTFTVVAALMDSGETQIISTTGANFYLEFNTTLALDFAGSDISASGIDGPYHAQLVMFDEASNPLSSVTHITQAYSSTDFETAVIKFVPPHLDVGIDTNGNGRFDELEINLTVQVFLAGTYSIQATLHDPTYELDLTETVTVALGVGQSVVTVLFDGRSINSSGIDGPYLVDLYAFNPSSYELYDTDYYMTSAYAAADFEEPGAQLGAPITDVGLDLNGNGLFDALSVSVPVIVNASAEYNVFVYARDATDTIVLDSDSEFGLWDPGMHNVELRLSTIPMQARGLDGPYTIHVRLILTDPPVGTIDSVVFMSANYSVDQFDPTPASLGSPPYENRGVDRSTPADGAYDVMRITVPVSVYEPGFYFITGDLYDPYFDYVAFDEADRYFLAGNYSVELNFAGPLISSWGVDGTYTADVALYKLVDNGLVLVQLVSTDTDSYFASDFAPYVPVVLSGSVYEAGTGDPLANIGLQAFNYLSNDNVWGFTNGVGQYLMPLYEGDWVIAAETNFDWSHQSELVNVSVAPGVTQDFSLTPHVSQTAWVNLTFSDWDHAERDRGWLYAWDNRTMRQYDEWWCGNRDQYLNMSEFYGCYGETASNPPPLPESSGDLFLRDGTTFSIVPGSNSYTWGNIEGSIWDPSLESGTETGAFNATAASVPGYVHTVEINVSYDLTYNDRIYQIKLPAGYVLRDYSAPAEFVVSGLGTGNVTIDPPLPARPNDYSAHAWVTLDAWIPDVTPPTIADLVATPNPVEIGSSITLGAHVTDDRAVQLVRVELRDSNNVSYGNFTMTGSGGNFTADFTPTVVVPFTYTVWAEDTAGNNATAVGTFTVVDTTPPVIVSHIATPSPQELGGAVTLKAEVTDVGGVDSVYAEIRDPHGGFVGNFSMTWVPANQTWEVTASFGALGTYTYTVWATDGSGGLDSAMGAFVMEDTTPPAIQSAATDPDPQELGGAVAFEASVVDLGGLTGVAVEVHGPSGSLLGNYTMTFDNGAGLWRTSQTFGLVGTYAFTIWAEDASGNVASSTGSFAIQDTTAPAFQSSSVTPDPQEIGSAVAFATTITDLGGVTQVNLEVHGPTGALLGNSTMTYDSGTGAWESSQTYSARGTYTYTIWAVDASGNVAPSTGSFVLRDTTLPVAAAGPDRSVVQGTTVTFNGSGSTDNDAVSTYAWAFSDGGAKTLSGATPTYTFANVGTFVVTLTVTDPSGNSATDTLTVTVSSPVPPVGAITGTVTGPDGNAVAGATVDLMSGSTLVASDTADAWGTFSFTGVAPGAYTLRVQAAGYDSKTTQVTVMAQQTVQSTIELTLTATTPPPAGIDWIPILAIAAVLAAAGVAALLYLRRRKA